MARFNRTGSATQEFESASIDDEQLYAMANFKHGDNEQKQNGIINLSFDDNILTASASDPNHVTDFNMAGDKQQKHEQTNNSNTDTRNEEPDPFRSLVPFCILFGLASLFSQSMGAYLSSQITVLEKSFGLSSSKSGILLSANDLGFVLFVLFSSHFLKGHHIPRILAICILIFGVSGILTSVPHFIADERMPRLQSSLTNTTISKSSHLCNVDKQDNSTESPKCHAATSGGVTASGDSQWVLGLIAAMMFIQGLAKAPRQPLSVLYLDNNSEKVKTGFYLGILSSFTILGPFMGITLGGVFNKIPVDLQETNLSPDDPRWIGAWWLGFIIFGACALVLSLPIFLFPSSLRKPVATNAEAAEYVNTAHVDKNLPVQQLFKDLPRSVGRVLAQPVYLSNLVSLLLFLMGVMTLGAFGPKYVENQFRIPTWKANIILGAEKLLTTVIGTFTGGVLTRRLRLDMAGCVKLILLTRCFSLGCILFNYILGCENPQVIGLQSYHRDLYKEGMTSNRSCDCSSAPYLPVCTGNRTYFSPCHAGCTTAVGQDYQDCGASISGTVHPGLCDSGCSGLIAFVALNGAGSLVGTLALAPAFVTTIRSVKEKDRAMGMGLQSFLMSLLVFLPAPIVFGKMYDSMCLVWNKDTCGGEGSCSLYDLPDMRIKMISVDVGLRVLSVLATVVALYYARRKIRPDSGQTHEQTLEVKPPVPQPRPSLAK